ncbi:MAG: hypothetical protein MHM6MM_008793 [Cercozoa sp. M6MM]
MRTLCDQVDGLRNLQHGRFLTLLPPADREAEEGSKHEEREDATATFVTVPCVHFALAFVCFSFGF